MDNTNEPNGDKLTKSVKQILSEQLGIDPEDINLDDSLTEDLHMQAGELSEMIELLENNKLDASRLDLTEIETVSDLIEAIASNVYID